MKKLFLFIFILSIIFSCAKTGRINDFVKEPAVYDSEKEYGEDLSAGTDKRSEKITEEKKSTPEKPESNNTAENTDRIIDNRKIIKNGSISYEVKELDKIESIVEKQVKDFGGYISSSNYNVNSVSINVKIPSEKFDGFLKEANNFGKITNKSISAQDVTKEYFDLAGRIKNKKIHQERIRNYISYAKNINDLMKYESELNRVTDELEFLEGNYKNLSHLIAFSTLNMEFYVPYLSEITRKWPSIKNGLSNLGYFMVTFLYKFIEILIYSIIIICFCIIPLTFIIGVIYYLTFGKIGFIKKMFKILSGESSKKISRK